MAPTPNTNDPRGTHAPAAETLGDHVEDRLGLFPARVVAGEIDDVGQSLGDAGHLRALGRVAVAAAAEDHAEFSFGQRAQGGQEPSNLLRFDGRTLVAIGAIALSMTGYVLQDARNTSRRDAEIETMKARVTRLEEIAATNTEGRVRNEVELGELREGQAEIKHMIEARDSGGKKAIPQK